MFLLDLWWSGYFWWTLFWESEFELVEEELEVLFWMGVPVHDDFAAIGGGQVYVEHLNGGELFQHGARCEALGCHRSLQSAPPAVSSKCTTLESGFCSGESWVRQEAKG